jgi:hypothetical protein
LLASSMAWAVPASACADTGRAAATKIVADLGAR